MKWQYEYQFVVCAECSAACDFCVATYRYSNAYILIVSYTVGGLSFVFLQ